MHFSKTILLWILFFNLSLSAQRVQFETPLSSRTSNYQIDVELDTEKRMLYATQKLEWKNPSNDTVRTIPFHMYLNAFKNTRSTFVEESSRSFADFTNSTLKSEEWSWVHIDNIKDTDGNDLTNFLEYTPVDDNNEHDQTVITLNLPKPVLPKETITLDMQFTVKIPKVKVRTGFSKEFYLNVQWYPKIGVYEPAGTRFAEEGQWNCHQYHAMAEYYGEFGVYDVNITVPKDYKVGASGELVKEDIQGDKKTYSFHIEDVIDFGWTASPQHMIVEETFQDVKIRLFISPEYECCTNRYISAAKNAMEYMGERLMPYPFPTLTIVVPPFHGVNAGAMEYPTFITAPGLYKFPSGLRTPEYFVIHEFVHQYFMMMVASNEQEEAWMDEGFTSYWKSRVLDHYYGKNKSVIDYSWINMGAMEFFRSRYIGMRNMSIANSTLPGWEYEYGSDRALFYSKPATWLRTLEGIVGTETMDALMKEYFHRWKFKHPCRFDFIDVVNEIVTQRHGDEFGKDMNWFFDQVLYGTEVCDYALAYIDNVPVKRKAMGIFEEKGMEASVQTINKNQKNKYNSSVSIHRLGGIQLPVEILVHFEDGREVLEKWDGKGRAFKFYYPTDAKIDYAIIDPQEKIYMDKNFLNNSLRTKPEKKTILKYVNQFMIKLQNVFQGISFLV